mmetsp:Transcript_22272/g.48656  ORF Transcript_22272/g.48656 Transcript_22272/m.48656 type:complete len:94 (+) Transcript_22272:78-359(+)
MHRMRTLCDVLVVPISMQSPRADHPGECGSLMACTLKTFMRQNTGTELLNWHEASLPHKHNKKLFNNMLLHKPYTHFPPACTNAPGHHMLQLA